MTTIRTTQRRYRRSTPNIICRFWSPAACVTHDSIERGVFWVCTLDFHGASEAERPSIYPAGEKFRLDNVDTWRCFRWCDINPRKLENIKGEAAPKAWKMLRVPQLVVRLLFKRLSAVPIYFDDKACEGVMFLGKRPPPWHSLSSPKTHKHAPPGVDFGLQLIYCHRTW